MTGAIDIFNCATRRIGFQNCRCKPGCRICGFGPHMAVHGPFYGKPVGSEPYNHGYAPDTRRAALTRDES
jgi:hypothetical protein